MGISFLFDGLVDLGEQEGREARGSALAAGADCRRQSERCGLGKTKTRPYSQSAKQDAL
jgi:hypothetical protein